MAEESHEFTGKTVDEAVAEGLSKLGISRSEVAVEVLSKGSRGIFGIGSEPARVRITIEPVRKSTRSSESTTRPPTQPVATEPRGGAEIPEPESQSESENDEDDIPTSTEYDKAVATESYAEVATGDEATAPSTKLDAGSESSDQEISDDELATMAAEMLGEVVRLMGFRADVVTSWQEPDDNEGAPYLMLDIEGQDLGALIGRRGETLASLQYLVRLMVNQRIKQWRNIVVDVEKYKERRITQLNQLSLRMADQVADSGRAVALEPMPPNERRIVHLVLRDHPRVYTQSSGEGDRRKVHIVPKDTV